jgi:hypothetical protein
VEDAEAEKIVKAAACVLASAAMELIYKDSHNWSARPCGTCTAISAIIGKPFGCDRYREEHSGSNRT